MSKFRIVGPNETKEDFNSKQAMFELCDKYNKLIELVMLELEAHVRDSTEVVNERKVVSAPKLLMELRRLNFELKRTLTLDQELNKRMDPQQ